jgi:hypothetical protein
MARLSGRNVSLSPPRRFMCDLLYFARQVPTVPVQRAMNLAAVVAARRRALSRPSWCTLFTKAYARVAAARPELRRSYLAFPRAHLYEHPHSVASIAIERRWHEEDAVFFAHLRAPEKQDLLKLDAALRRFKHEPLASVGMYRRMARLGRLPWPLRWLVWWTTLNGSGYRRARQLGTFGVSVYSSLGCESLHPLSPLTTTLNYGVISPQGDVTVRLVYDHRVLDGATVARALLDLERVLNQDIFEELRALRPVGKARGPRRPPGRQPEQPAADPPCHTGETRKG